MQIDFSSLLEPIQKTRVQVGTTGTAFIHAGLPRPQTLIPRGDKRGRILRLNDGERQTKPALPPMPPTASTLRGHEKASNHAVFPAAPTLETMTDAERDALATKLRLFRFDLITQEIAEGYPADELHRVNNLCWEIMQADGLPFNEAMWIAAEIVAACNMAECERSYTSVQALWRRITRPVRAHEDEAGESGGGNRGNEGSRAAGRTDPR